ncbi:cytochrome c [Scleromatobacter humisilvae]|uniref:Cytochrome c n=1 Tax=Scleromatobacter humisilvae TaxID=2897159 RepID=A0A9X2C1M9_9BURK|nr:cytochrome c [Scleromatobacter humisilvae]MCK9685160.1 cytochrome c [Scleromatobacter humisilvae]
MSKTLATIVAAGLAGAVAAAHAADPAAVARGKYLFEASDCSGCHAGNGTSADPSGGLGLDTPFGTFRAPNITPDKRYGIGSWSQAEFQRALREGVGKHGEYLFPVFPYTSFTRLTDSDTADLYAYLMTLPPVAAPDKPHAAKAPFDWRPLLLGWRTLFFSEGVKAPDPTKSAEWNRGDYLVHAVGHCGECHTPRNALGAMKASMAFSGNVGGPDGQNAPNITSDVATGIGDWSVADIQNLLKTGMTPDSDLVGSGMKAVVRGTSKLTDADRHAMAVYIKSLPPIHVDPPPKPPAKK